MQPAIGNQLMEGEPNSPGSTMGQSHKRKRIASAKSGTVEAHEPADTELKRLRRMLEELREENRQREERHERDLEDLKDQNRWLRKVIEDFVQKT